MARREALEPYYRIDSNEAMAMLDSDPDNIVVVDVRNDDEWARGHVTGAIHVFIDELEGRIDEVPQGKKLLFICEIGVRSGLGCEVALSKGYDTKNLYNIEDGTPGWIKGNHPTSYGNDP